MMDQATRELYLKRFENGYDIPDTEYEAWKDTYDGAIEEKQSCKSRCASGIGIKSTPEFIATALPLLGRKASHSMSAAASSTFNKSLPSTKGKNNSTTRQLPYSRPESVSTESRPVYTRTESDSGNTETGVHINTLKKLNKQPAAVEHKLDLILQKVEKLSKTVSKIVQWQKEQEAMSYSIDHSPHRDRLWSKIAEEFCLNFKRELSDQKCIKIVKDVLGDESKVTYKVNAALKWAKKKFSSFRSDERRKVLGLRPYKEYARKSTKQLAASIMRATRAPISNKLQHTYTRNLTVLRRYVRLESEEARGPGALHNKFAEWFGEGIPESAWEEILEDDKEAYKEDQESEESLELFSGED